MSAVLGRGTRGGPLMCRTVGFENDKTLNFKVSLLVLLKLIRDGGRVVPAEGQGPGHPHPHFVLAV